MPHSSSEPTCRGVPEIRARTHAIGLPQGYTDACEPRRLAQHHTNVHPDVADHAQAHSPRERSHKQASREEAEEMNMSAQSTQQQTPGEPIIVAETLYEEQATRRGAFVGRIFGSVLGGLEIL